MSFISWWNHQNWLKKLNQKRLDCYFISFDYLHFYVDINVVSSNLWEGKKIFYYLWSLICLKIWSLKRLLICDYVISSFPLIWHYDSMRLGRLILCSMVLVFSIISYKKKKSFMWNLNEFVQNTVSQDNVSKNNQTGDLLRQFCLIQRNTS